MAAALFAAPFFKGRSTKQPRPMFRLHVVRATNWPVSAGAVECVIKRSATRGLPSSVHGIHLFASPRAVLNMTGVHVAERARPETRPLALIWLGEPRTDLVARIVG